MVVLIVVVGVNSKPHIWSSQDDRSICKFLALLDDNLGSFGGFNGAQTSLMAFLTVE